MTVTLQNYVTAVQRLLHDTSASFWSVSELTDYINAGRTRLVKDTGCLRTLQTANVSTNVESYIYSSTLPNGNVTFDVVNMNVIWGNTAIPLYYLPWTDFNAKFRSWQNFTGRPIAFSVYGGQTVYIGPKPDQTYSAEFDTVIAPAPLVNLTDADTIPDIWTSPVQYYASNLAKNKEQSYGEAEIFMQKYRAEVQNVIAGTMTRRLFSPYTSRY